ncbi:hypothetical protein V2G26_010846 [Clonostachys chloroleuca]
MDPEWLIIIKDRKDAGDKHTTRVSAHLAGMRADPKDRWVFAGYNVVQHVQDRKNATLTGRVLVGRASSKEVLEARIKSDAFVTEGVWDPETLVITPFVSTFRQPLLPGGAPPAP